MSSHHLVVTQELPNHCTPTNTFLAHISSAFHTCIPTPLAFTSQALGVCSIIVWLCAQIPQIVKNYKLQSASGISIYFLLVWLLGDVANLVGGLLTGQAGWQMALATYYVTVDLCLSGQYFWYLRVKPWRAKGVLVPNVDENCDMDDGPDAREPVVETIRPERQPRSPPLRLGSKKPIPRNFESHHLDRHRNSQHGKKHISSVETNEKTPDNLLDHLSPREARARSAFLPPLYLLALTLHTAIASPIPIPTVPTSPFSPTTTIHPSPPLLFLGQLISWLSTASYLLSRLPQLWKNYRRKSTSGLSPWMFLATFSGNFLYSAAIVFNPLAWASYPPYGAHGWVGREGSDRREWVELAAPFWLGAAGVLALDGCVGVQFFLYGEKEKVEVLVPIEEGEERKGRWKMVRGWMRGWIPSRVTSPVRGERAVVGVVDTGEGEEECLLEGNGGVDRPRGYGAA